MKQNGMTKKAVCRITVLEIRKIPTVTSVDEWTNDDAGVGAAIAAGKGYLGSLGYSGYKDAKLQISKNPRWRTAAILKSLKRYISVKSCPILMKFGAQKWIPIKLAPMQKFKIFEIQEADVCHF